MKRLGIIGVVAFVLAALSVSPSAATLTWTTLGTHQDAAAQPSARGKTIHDLHQFENRLYVGYGDYGDNTGPIRHRPWNPSTNAWEDEGLQDTEEVNNYQTINGSLYSPSVDPACCGSPLELAANASDYAVLSGTRTWPDVDKFQSHHVFDMRAFGTSIIASGSSDGCNVSCATVWKSDNGGTSWSQWFYDTTDATNQFGGHRCYDLASFGTRAWANCTTGMKTYNGSSWVSDSTQQYGHKESVVFNSTLVAPVRGNLYSWNGTSESTLRSGSHKFTSVDRTQLYVADTSGNVYVSTNLSSWTSVGTMPTSATSFAAVCGKLYYGTTASTIHVSTPSTTIPCTTSNLTQSQSPQGAWVGTYGSDGYDLASWTNTTSTGDLVSFPKATVTWGSNTARHQWSTNSTEARALQAPDQSHRRLTTAYNSNGTTLTATLTFNQAYSGNLHLYQVDGDSTARRQTITVNDGSGNRSSAITSAFNNGMWVTAPITVASSGTVTITATATAGANAVLSGIFLGGSSGSTQCTGSPTQGQGVQGDWVGTYGADGYALWAWNNTTSTGDQVSFPKATITYQTISRHQWSTNAGAVRALEAPDQSHQRATAIYNTNGTQFKVFFAFNQAYNGELHLYMLDWENGGRRQNITINDASGSGDRTVNVTTAFNNGNWVHAPINVANGATVTVTVDRTAGDNAVLSGAFIDPC